MSSTEHGPPPPFRREWGDRGEVRTIDFWSDIGCPWASLAVHRFRRVRSSMGLDGRVVLRHRTFPLELINHNGTPKPTLDAERDVLLSLEPSLGWRPWGTDESLYPESMLPPLEAVRAAQRPEVGGLRASEDLDAALRTAFYAESRPIALHTEILAVAGECPSVDAGALAWHLERGTARLEIFTDLREWRGAGVQGSPHLVLPDGAGVHNPGLSIEWFQDHAEEWHLKVLSDLPDVYARLLEVLS